MWLGQKSFLRLGGIEKIESVLDHAEQSRVARCSDPARNADGVIAAIARQIDRRVLDESGAIAFILEAPDRPGVAKFEFLLALGRLFPGVEGDRIDPVDGKTGVAV